MKERTFTQKCNISLNGILSVLRYDKKFFFAILDTKKEETTFYRFYGYIILFGNISTVTRIFIVCRVEIFHKRKRHDISYFVLYHFSLKSILIENYYTLDNQQMIQRM